MDTTILMKNKEIKQKEQEKSQLLHTTAQNLSSRGLSISEIAGVLSMPEAVVPNLLK